MNFYYMLGANTNVASLQVNSPDFVVPDAVANWKPHPYYLDRSHPLRKALNAQAGGSAEAETYMREAMNASGGFNKVMNGVAIHEMFHVKEGIDNTLGLVKRRVDQVDRKLLVTQLDDSKLKDLFSAYTGIVFKIGKSLGEGKDAKELLEKLAVV